MRRWAAALRGCAAGAAMLMALASQALPVRDDHAGGLTVVAAPAHTLRQPGAGVVDGNDTATAAPAMLMATVLKRPDGAHGRETGASLTPLSPHDPVRAFFAGRSGGAGLAWQDWADWLPAASSAWLRPSGWTAGGLLLIALLGASAWCVRRHALRAAQAAAPPQLPWRVRPGRPLAVRPRKRSRATVARHMRRLDTQPAPLALSCEGWRQPH